MDPGFLLDTYRAGRCLMGSLSTDTDIIEAVAEACTTHRIRFATFAASGFVSLATFGGFDPAQLVHVTEALEKPMEILHCEGNVAPGKTGFFVHGRIALATLDGQVVGGRLFPETRIRAGELMLQEWIGPPRHRQYDPATGLWALIRSSPAPNAPRDP